MDPKDIPGRPQSRDQDSPQSREDISREGAVSFEESPLLLQLDEPSTSSLQPREDISREGAVSFEGGTLFLQLDEPFTSSSQRLGELWTGGAIRFEEGPFLVELDQPSTSSSQPREDISRKGAVSYEEGTLFLQLDEPSTSSSQRRGDIWRGGAINFEKGPLLLHLNQPYTSTSHVQVVQPETEKKDQPSPQPSAQSPSKLTNKERADLQDMDQLLMQRAVNNTNEVVPDLDGSWLCRGSQLPGTGTLQLGPPIFESKKGTTDRPIRLQANYFQLMRNMDWTLYQYDVDFEPEENRTEIKKRLFAIATKDVLMGYLFNGSTVYTVRQPEQKTVLFVVNSPENGREQPTNITMRHTGNVTLENDIFKSLFKALMMKCFKSVNGQLVGRNLFEPLTTIQVDGNEMELFPDYISTIRQYENSIMLCCEISQKFIRKGNVLNALMEIRKENPYDFKGRFSTTIVNNVVLTYYNDYLYHIDDVEWMMSPQATLYRRDGQDISYIQYYQERYNLHIKDIDQPLLVSRVEPCELNNDKPDIHYLVPELCRMTGFTDEERNNVEMMQQLTEHMNLSPGMHLERLNVFQSRLRFHTKVVEELNRWDLVLANKPAELTGRVLSPESIIQGTDPKYEYTSGDKGDWTQNLHTNKMLLPAIVDAWTVITPEAMRTDVLNFVQLLLNVAHKMSLNLPEPRYELVFGEESSAYLEAIDRAMLHNIQLMLVCVPNNRLGRYRAIKKKTLVDNSVPTQLMLKKTMLSKDVLSIATSLVIQINCKLGGAPWTVDMPLSSLMVMGIDVRRDTVCKGRTFCALVANLNKCCTNYFSAVSEYYNSDQLFKSLVMNIIKAMNQWRALHNDDPPNQIIIYRDGLDDNQLSSGNKQEVKLIQDLLTSYYEGKPLMFAYIVVKKDIKTRIFNGMQNPPPGTVVDDVITLPQCHDFYVVSQYAHQGIVSPTYYSVIHDTIGLDADKIQQLTYKFTHLYYNWSRTVRVPACCQYAHKLAKLIAQDVHQIPSAALENTLYYL